MVLSGVPRQSRLVKSRTGAAMEQNTKHRQGTPAQRLQILLHEHQMIREEILSTQGFFKNNIAALSVVLAGLYGVMGWVNTNYHSSPNMTTDVWSLALIGVFLINPICGYFLFDFLHSGYSLHLMGRRIEAIETQVEKEFGKNLLIWEKIAHPFSTEFRPAGVFNPSYFHVILTSIIFFFIMGVMPGLGYLILLRYLLSSPTIYGGVALAVASFISAIIFLASMFYADQSLRVAPRRMREFVANAMKEAPAAAQ